MVSTIRFYRKGNTMRILILCLAALLLTGCNVVVVPVPVAVPATPAILLVPEPTPTAEPTAEPTDSWAAFQDAYATFAADFDLFYARLEGGKRFADPDWRAETALIAQQWRRDIAVLQAFDQPEGERWLRAWPLLQDALVEFDAAAAAAEDAAIQGDPALAQPAAAHMSEGARLLNQMANGD